MSLKSRTRNTRLDDGYSSGSMCSEKVPGSAFSAK